MILATAASTPCRTHPWRETQLRFLHLNSELAEAFTRLAQEAKEAEDWHRFERYRDNAASAHSSMCEILADLGEVDRTLSRSWSARCHAIGSELVALR